MTNRDHVSAFSLNVRIQLKRLLIWRTISNEMGPNSETYPICTGGGEINSHEMERSLPIAPCILTYSLTGDTWIKRPTRYIIESRQHLKVFIIIKRHLL